MWWLPLLRARDISVPRVTQEPLAPRALTLSPHPPWAPTAHCTVHWDALCGRKHVCAVVVVTVRTSEREDRSLPLRPLLVSVGAFGLLGHEGLFSYLLGL